MATKIEIRATTVADMIELTKRIRPADLAEVVAAGSKDAASAVNDCVSVTDHPRTLLVNEEVAAVFGVATASVSIAGSLVGVPWALTTDTVEKYPKEFYRVSKAVAARMFRDNPVLVNYVDDRYTSAIKWLRKLGFWVGEPEAFGVGISMFRPFVRMRESTNV